MPLTPDQAANVARRHGLSLMDAAGLLSLADTETEADRIAASFAGTDAEAATREFAAALFGKNEPSTNTPAKPADDGNPEVRRFVADLFDRSDP